MRKPEPCARMLQTFCVLRKGHKGACTTKFPEERDRERLHDLLVCPVDGEEYYGDPDGLIDHFERVHQ